MAYEIYKCGIDNNKSIISEVDFFAYLINQLDTPEEKLEAVKYFTGEPDADI